jgi:hypothetical protein
MLSKQVFTLFPCSYFPAYELFSFFSNGSDS